MRKTIGLIRDKYDAEWTVVSDSGVFRVYRNGTLLSTSGKRADAIASLCHFRSRDEELRNA